MKQLIPKQQKMHHNHIIIHTIDDIEDNLSKIAEDIAIEFGKWIGDREHCVSYGILEDVWYGYRSDEENEMEYKRIHTKDLFEDFIKEYKKRCNASIEASEKLKSIMKEERKRQWETLNKEFGN